ncbi:Penicillin-binding protein 2 [Halorhodospira halochloris]|uniref:Peptidoglycan D,D-transpeptidase MrdA n=1 Tax=Halorhodospira halochloris TaxID=1052 RepID=A0A0X8X6H9_HALHR|nr:penicillin-binding protein 2 [Halorhodospira halochloris]BAU56495.1 Penicillin-binding protein 2 [Halorhodospira halochloris]
MSEASRIPDHHRDAHITRTRIILAGTVCLITVLIVLSQMVRLQIVDHQHYATLSHENRIKVTPIPPTRGLIYDRNGHVLAENRPSYQLTLIPERVPDLEKTLEQISQIVHVSDAQKERFKTQLQRSRRFEEVPLRSQLDDEEVAKLAVHRHRFPGMEVNARLVRHYPNPNHSSHAVGHVGHITREDLRRIDQSTYRGTHHIGKSGIELAFEDTLRGEVGFERVETNALGRVIRSIERTPPKPGNDLILTIDSKLQEVAERAIGDERGAVVAIEPQSGEILALASQPSYDPNKFVEGMTHQRFRELERTGWQPLYNRASRGTYSPASTIKPFVGLAALEHGVIEKDTEVNCDGEFFLEGRDRPYRCWRETGHGDINFGQALAESCNVFFYDTSFKLGIDRMSKFLEQFGFGAQTTSDIPGERRGVLPSRDWKRGAIGQGWFHGETVITGIGLGYFNATPLQLATATAILGNRGELITPRLVRGVADGANNDQNSAIELGQATETTPTQRIDIDDPSHWEETIEGMRLAIQHYRGTARLINENLNYDFAGKTGTAQITERDVDDDEERPEHLRNHALFIGLAPADDPQIAIAVVIEHGGSGGAAAAPVARAVVDYWMLQDKTYLQQLEQGRIDASEVEDEEDSELEIAP